MPSPEFIGLDIETKPRPELVDRFSKPFPDFDANAVKCGNLKDPVKIAEKINQAKADHEAECEAYWKNLRDRAALNPFTGEILIIGLVNEHGDVRFLEGNEATILGAFWELFIEHGQAQRRFVYWSGCGNSSQNFDIDYIVTRSRILGIPVPATARNGRFYSSRIIDLASEFLLHRHDAYLKLTVAADILGLYDVPAANEANPIYPKQEDDTVTGENFHLWYDGKADAAISLEDQRTKAKRYLRNDVLHLLSIAPRIL
jgi:hypothetical protein